MVFNDAGNRIAQQAAGIPVNKNNIYHSDVGSKIFNWLQVCLDE